MANQQNFIGSIIAGKVIGAVVGNVLDKVAANKHISLEPKDVPAVKEIVTRHVESELEKRDQHATNTEPAYQSRVAQGSSAAVLMAVATIWQFWTDGIAQGPLEYTPPVLVVVGGLWALYGRFIARKPFGA